MSKINYSKRERAMGYMIYFILCIMLLSYISANYPEIIFYIWMFVLFVLAPTMTKVCSYFIKKHRYLRSGIRQADKMTGDEFEQYLETHFKKHGYRVKRVGQTGDFGADLILYKRFSKIVVQAKRYSKNVGVAAVQQVISAKAYYHADYAMVVTNSHFTSAAKKMAKECEVSLWDRDTIIKNFRLN